MRFSLPSRQHKHVESRRITDTIEACHALLKQHHLLEQQQDQINQSLARQNEQLKFEIEQLKRYIYGRRSERYTDDGSQLTFFAAEQDVQPEAADEDDEALEEITYTRRKRSKADRFPENLPREVQTIDVPEDQRLVLAVANRCRSSTPMFANDWNMFLPK